MTMMQIIAEKKNIILKYLFFLLWFGAILVFRNDFGLTGWMTFLTALFLVAFPGFLLLRIFNFGLKNDKLGRLILIIALGFCFNFILAFVAIVLGLTLPALILTYICILAFLYVLSLFLEFFRPKEVIESKKMILRDIFNVKNLLYLGILVLLGYILITVDSQGSNFKGDPYFHLAIMRKIMGGLSLEPSNLNYIRQASIHPAYGFPIWHVYLSVVTFLNKSNIFNTWSQIPVPLTVIVMAVWYWLYQRIMPAKTIALVSFVLFVAFTYQFNDGYMFTRLAVPDTLAQLLFLPLIFSLAIEYIFNKKTDYKLLILFSVLALLMAAIHFPQYFYFLITMVILLVVYLIFFWKDKDFKETVKRILWTILGGLVVVLPLVGLLELKGHVVSNTIKGFWAEDPNKMKLGYEPFKGVDMLARYAYMAIPLFILAAKKYRRLIFIFALLLVMPLTYYKIFGIRYYLIKLLGYIFLNRLYPNVTWAHAFWGLGLGLIILGISIWLVKIGKIKKYFAWMLNILLLLVGGLMVYKEVMLSVVSNFYKKYIIGVSVAEWILQNYLWVSGGLALLVLIICLINLWLKKNWLAEVTYQEKIISPITVTILTLIVGFVFLSPNYKSSMNVFIKEFKEKKSFISQKDHIGELLTYSAVGGKETIEFVNQNLPAKSIFMTDSASATPFSLLTDQFLMAYPRTNEESLARRAYKTYLDPIERLKIIGWTNANYIFIKNSSTDDLFYKKYPQYFEPVYSTNVIIYKINSKEIKKNYPYKPTKKDLTS